MDKIAIANITCFAFFIFTSWRLPVNREPRLNFISKTYHTFLSQGVFVNLIN